jgi:hypothetical protein
MIFPSKVQGKEFSLHYLIAFLLHWDSFGTASEHVGHLGSVENWGVWEFLPKLQECATLFFLQILDLEISLGDFTHIYIHHIHHNDLSRERLSTGFFQ